METTVCSRSALVYYQGALKLLGTHKELPSKRSRGSRGIPMPRLHFWLVVIVVLLGIGCTSTDKQDLSPLATWDPSNADIFNQAASGKGTLDISASCVRLILDNQTTILPVWPEPTSWNPSSQTIEFVDVFGERIELRAGDQIILGGSTAIVKPQFVSPPDPSCKAEQTFRVNALTVVTD